MMLFSAGGRSPPGGWRLGVGAGKGELHNTSKHRLWTAVHGSLSGVHP